MADKYSRSFVTAVRAVGNHILYLEAEAVRNSRDDVLCALMRLREIANEKEIVLKQSDVVSIYTDVTGHVIGDVRQLTTAHKVAAARVGERNAAGNRLVETFSKAMAAAAAVVSREVKPKTEKEKAVGKNGKNMAGKGTVAKG